MSRRISPVTLILTLAIALAMPTAAFAENGDTGAAVAPTQSSTGTSTDDPAATPSMTLTPDQIAGLEAQAAAANEASSPDSRSFLEKATDFVSDNAPFFVIGIIVIAAILAGILIVRGRHRSAGTAVAAGGAGAVAASGGRPNGPGAPAETPSATELRRRKRAAMQKAREEERMRRKVGKSGRARDAAPVPAMPQTTDPVEAEKQAARDQAQAAGAVARSAGAPAAANVAPVPSSTPPSGGAAIPAPVSPSQTAPATGIVTPAAAAAAAQASSSTTASRAGQSPAPAQPDLEPRPAVSVEPDTEVDMPVAPAEPEPSIEAPGPDLAVGKAAAAFAAGAAGGAVAGRATGTAQGPSDTQVSRADDLLQAKVAEIKAAQSPAAELPQPEPEPEPKPEPAPAPQPESDSVPQTESTRPAPDPHLAAIEQRLTSDSKDRDRTLREAEQRLQLIEQRAEDAERRAAFAEKLALLKIEEGEREQRLDRIITGIDRAEQRAHEAEQRAESAERAATSALEGRALPGRESTGSSFASDFKASDRSFADSASRPEPAPARLPATPAPTDSLNLNTASFEQLREADLSVTQATRILAYRERFGGYRSVEDLEKVPGFPPELVDDLHGKLTV